MYHTEFKINYENSRALSMSSIDNDVVEIEQTE